MFFKTKGSLPKFCQNQTVNVMLQATGHKKGIHSLWNYIVTKQGCIKHFNEKVFRVTVDLFSGLKCWDFADCFGFWNLDFRKFGNKTIQKSITTNLDNSAIIWWGNED
jgi:hypothetical protein